MKALLILLAILPGLLMAQETAPGLPDLSVPSGMVSRDLPLGYADYFQVEDLCRQTLSEEGKFHIFKTTRKVRVIGKPQDVEAVRQILEIMAATPPQMVRVEFKALGVSQSGSQGGRITGTLPGSNDRGLIQGRNTPGVIRTQDGRIIQPGGGTINSPTLGGSIEVDVLNQQSSGGSMSNTWVTMRAGSEGFIEVAREVPMIDFFTRFIADGSFAPFLGNRPQILNNPNVIPLTGGRFEVPDIRWEKAGTRLVVLPSVSGDLIHLEITPQIRSIQIVRPEVLRARQMNTWLTGQDQFVTFTGLSTTVTIQSGVEMPIGGFSEAGPEFSHFFGGGIKGGRTSSTQMTVKATLVGPTGQ